MLEHHALPWVASVRLAGEHRTLFPQERSDIPDLVGMPDDILVLGTCDRQLWGTGLGLGPISL